MKCGLFKMIALKAIFKCRWPSPYWKQRHKPFYHTKKRPQERVGGGRGTGGGRTCCFTTTPHPPTPPHHYYAPPPPSSFTDNTPQLNPLSPGLIVTQDSTEPTVNHIARPHLATAAVQGHGVLVASCVVPIGELLWVALRFSHNCCFHPKWK